MFDKTQILKMLSKTQPHQVKRILMNYKQPILPLYGQVQLPYIAVPSVFLIPQIYYEHLRQLGLPHFAQEQNALPKCDSTQELSLNKINAQFQIPHEISSLNYQKKSGNRSNSGERRQSDENELKNSHQFALDGNQIKEEDNSCNLLIDENCSNEDMKKRGKGKLWSKKEINHLIFYYKQYRGKWSEIIKHLSGRNISQCSQKYRKLNEKQKRTKRKWTFNEDKILLEEYNNVGSSWVRIAQKLPGRSCKQVRDRFVNKLNPRLDMSPWTDEEDKLILEEYRKNGPKWTQISLILVKRSENQVKNRFYYSIQPKYIGLQHKYLKIQKNGVSDNDFGVNHSIENKVVPNLI